MREQVRDPLVREAVETPAKAAELDPDLARALAVVEELLRDPDSAARLREDPEVQAGNQKKDREILPIVAVVHLQSYAAVMRVLIEQFGQDRSHGQWARRAQTYCNVMPSAGSRPRRTRHENGATPSALHCWTVLVEVRDKG